MPANWPSSSGEVDSTQPISLQPKTLDLKLYGGDGAKLRLNVKDSKGEPINLTGEITAQIRASRSNPDAVASFTTEVVDAANGIADISLTGDQTHALHGSPASVETFKGVWDVQWVPVDAEPVTLFQGSVESELDVTRT